MLSPRAQVHFSVALFLLGLAFYVYFSFLLRPILAPLILPASGPGASDRNINLALNPKAHIHRAPRRLQFHWNITSGLRAPDGVTKLVYLINGEFPGPLIEARSGDEVIVEIYNGLENNEGTSIHWHGLSLREANNMDGVVGLTQSPILPMETFTYRFKIEDSQSGSFWYHAHSDVQRGDGLYGPLIVHKPADKEFSDVSVPEFEEDMVLMVGDWYHRSSQAVLDYYTDYANFKIEPPPDSILLNGKGLFNCSMAVPARPVVCETVEVPRLFLQKSRIRLRVINTGAISGLTLSLSEFEMTVLEVDGGAPVSNRISSQSVGIVYPGERIDLIVQKLQDDVEDPQLTIELDPESLKFRNFALTPTQHFPISAFTDAYASTRLENVPNVPYFSLSNITGLSGSEVGRPELSVQTLLFYTRISVLAHYGNRPKGFINRTSWPVVEAIDPPIINLDRDQWENQYFVPRVESGLDQWLDIVLNNVDDKGHPFHLHGNSFYVLSTYQAEIGSYDAYNPFDVSKSPAGGSLNFVNPIRKDTIYVPPMGYVVLRIRADNRGLWFFHCHVLWHHAVGMGMALDIG